MRGRWIVVLMLAGVLWGCPYLCLGSPVIAGRDPVKRCCCGNDGCQRSQPGPRSEQPAKSSGACLCHGAVFEPRAAQADLHLQCDALVVLLSTPASPHATRAFADLFRWQHARHFPTAEGGRKVRALCESLLI